MSASFERLFGERDLPMSGFDPVVLVGDELTGDLGCGEVLGPASPSTCC